MDELLAVINRIIRQHRVILKRIETLEKVANDAEAMVGFEKAKEVFMPGRLEQKESLGKFQYLVQVISNGLQTHFNFEETELLRAFEKHGNKKLSEALHTLLLEHDDLRNRIVQTKMQIAELTGGGLTRHKWEASAYDLRAHISHTRKLLEAHAGIEQELLRTLRQELRVESKKKA